MKDVQIDFGTGKKTISIYLFGVVCCVVLTLIAFSAVMSNVLTRTEMFTIIYLSASLQFFIQVTYFLRLNIKTMQSQLNVIAFIYTLMILICFIAGSLWIMWNLHYYMGH